MPREVFIAHVSASSTSSLLARPTSATRVISWTKRMHSKLWKSAVV